MFDHKLKGIRPYACHIQLKGRNLGKNLPEISKYELVSPFSNKN